MVPSSHSWRAPPQLYSVKETCARLNIGRTLLYGLVADGKLTPVKIGGRTLFAESELDRYIAELMAAAA